MTARFKIQTTRHIFYASHIEWQDAYLKAWGRFALDGRISVVHFPVKDVHIVEEISEVSPRRRHPRSPHRGHFTDRGEWVGHEVDDGARGVSTQGSRRGGLSGQKGHVRRRRKLGSID